MFTSPNSGRYYVKCKYYSKQQKKDKRQVNEKICNLEREYRDCIKSRRDKIGITRHIMMHQVLYIYCAVAQ